MFYSRHREGARALESQAPDISRERHDLRGFSRHQVARPIVGRAVGINRFAGHVCRLEAPRSSDAVPVIVHFNRTAQHRTLPLYKRERFFVVVF